MSLTTDTIAAAEAIAGLDYTDTERALMLETIGTQIALAQARRAISFPNALPMASRFDPRLPGFSLPPMADGADWTPPDPGPLPTDAADIAFAPIPRLAGWMRAGAISSRALTELYLDRIATHAPRLLCFVTVMAERALAEADAADALLADGHWLGPLHGLPYALKDLFDAEGAPTTWGAEPFQDRSSEGDARVVTMLRAAGAVLLGKSTVGALAYGDIWFGGQTRNPWNPDEGSSGSSAGSASAAAAGLCAFAIGTETLGSITSPSQRCGTTGLRPTFGRVSRTGAMALCWSLDKVGPICRGVEDCALVLAAINGGDPTDRSSLDIPFVPAAAGDLEGVRVGYLPDVFDARAGATEVDRSVLDTLRDAGLSPRAVSLPDLPWASLTSILQAEAAAAFEELTLSDDDDRLTWQVPRAWPNSFRQARFLSAVDHVQLDRLRYRVMQALDRLFEEVDILVGPHGIGPMLVASNFTGHPCLHLRTGFIGQPTRPPLTILAAPGTPGPDHRVPTGISLWSGLFDEARLCRVGQVLEAALDVSAERPAGF